MSLAAVIRTDGDPLEPSDLQRMYESMSWRFSGDWVPVEVGGMIACVVDSSFAHGSDTQVVVIDGHLHNERSLAAELGLTRPTIAELVSTAFERWGPSAPSRFLGDFAGLVFDRATRVTWSFRDHLGVRPLFFARGHELVVVASSVDAILASGLVKPALNTRRLVGLLVDEYGPAPTTSFRGIERLLPGTVMEFSPGRSDRLTYWSPPEVIDNDRGPEETASRLRNLLTEAVNARMEGADRTVSQVSGGLDSSTVARLADRTGHIVETLSMRFTGQFAPIDEAPYIEAVREGMAGPHHDIDGAADTTLSSFLDICDTWPEPAIAPNHQFSASGFRFAAQNGIGLCLGGFDGDTTISHGRSLFVDLARAGEYEAWRQSASRYSTVMGVAPGEIVRAHGAPLVADSLLSLRWGSAAELWRCLGRVSSPADARSAVLSASRRRLRSRVKSKVLGGFSPVRPGALTDLAGQMMEHADRQTVPITEQASHRQVLTAPLMSFALEVLDHHSRIAGVALAHPFLDVRIIELMVATDPRHKLRDGWTRRPLRDATEGILPDAVRWRTDKANFEPVFLTNLLVRDSEIVYQLVEDELWRLGDIVDPAAVRDLVGRTVGRERVVVHDVYTLWRMSAALGWLTRRGLSA